MLEARRPLISSCTAAGPATRPKAMPRPPIRSCLAGLREVSVKLAGAVASAASTMSRPTRTTSPSMIAPASANRSRASGDHSSMTELFEHSHRRGVDRFQTVVVEHLERPVRVLDGPPRQLGDHRRPGRHAGPASPNHGSVSQPERQVPGRGACHAVQGSSGDRLQRGFMATGVLSRAWRLAALRVGQSWGPSGSVPSGLEASEARGPSGSARRKTESRCERLETPAQDRGGSGRAAGVAARPRRPQHARSRARA